MSALKVKRKLTSAQIFGSRYRCWRCNGARSIDLAGTGILVPCPSCHGADPIAANSQSVQLLTSAVAEMRRAA
jgi:DnaJ-class molecular chaperone